MIATAATAPSQEDEETKSLEKESDEEEEIKNEFSNKVVKDVMIDEPIVAYQSSQLAIAPELTNYLKGLLKEPFNKYCLDCKINLSTHAIVFFGTFVCYDCMLKIKNVYGYEYSYPKKVIGEHWDDY